MVAKVTKVNFGTKVTVVSKENKGAMVTEATVLGKVSVVTLSFG
jgi:hypothetical protein